MKMKAFAALFLLSGLIVSNLASSQSLFVGIESGPAVSKLFGNSILKYSHVGGLSYYGGIQGQFQLNSHWSIKGAVSFEIRNSNYLNINVLDSNGMVSQTLRSYNHMNFISIPLMARYEFGVSRNFFVNAGPSISCLATYKVKTNINYGTQVIDQPKLDNKLEVGLCAGAGYQLNLGKSLRVSAELRNTTGLNSLVNRDKVIHHGTVQTTTTYLLFGCQYRLAK
ncbi:MAG: outer membrane beta-barrel protein [Bacteroidetes bacterium]|nr:outer membrane beta-barrel protein [Bacteroidota bacterium]